jgi:Zn-dependent protease with chaperone function
MNFGLLLVGAALMAFPAAVGRRAGRLPSAEWTRVSVFALVLGAWCAYTGLLMTATPPVLHSLDLEGVLSICDPVVHNLMIGGPLVGWAAAGLAAVVTACAIQALQRTRRAPRVARVQPSLGEHISHGDYELVVLPTHALIAVGIPGPVPQVVVSQGLMDQLDPTRVEAVIGHELAHLRLGHRPLLVAVTVVERALGLVPLVRRSAQVVRQALETWADDVAVEHADATEPALHAALVAVASAQRSPWDLHEYEAVATRAHRLLHPSPCLPATVRGLTYLPAGGLLFGAAALAVGWALTSQQMVSVSGYC